MKTLFNFLKMGGGRIIFCLTLALFVIDLNSQTTRIYFTGKSLFRNYSFGVMNHCFRVENIFPNDDDMKQPCTGSCPSSYGDSIKVSPTLNGSDNDLSITPYSANDLEDYQNGISVADAVIILRHVNDVEYITDPYKMVAADCNDNHEIDSDDAEQIEDLVGEDIEFTRNSWEWFSAQEINNNWGSFQSDPYSWTISDGWSGNIFWLNVSSSTLSSSTTQPQYSYFRTTKIGELDNNESNPNDWVCDSYSFKPDKEGVDRLISGKNDHQTNSLKIGTSVQLDYYFELSDLGITYFQLPVKVDFDYLKVKGVFTNEKLNIKYKINESKNEFFAWYLNYNFNRVVKSIANENVIRIELEVVKNIDDINNYLYIDQRKKFEAGDYNLASLKPKLELSYNSSANTSFVVLKDGIYYYGMNPAEIELQILDLVGRILKIERVIVSSGFNPLKINISGFNNLFIRIIDGDANYVFKYINE
ncbi:MAG: hypothetical protein IPM92_00805 [Saprospiraceae bacterium]|nr:hypothetical protein [Saprospiraceae bacterium]